MLLTGHNDTNLSPVMNLMYNKMPNKYIIDSLNAYIENPDPRYALMLKGQWGCGKTYLVNTWIEDVFKNEEKKDDVVLEPIRVTLYGMTNTDEITKAIDRQLHPFLYSKAAKIGAGILKIAGKIVLRTDLDFDNDGTKDATLSTSLDSLSFLASKDKEITPGTLKLLVFDDLERSHIPMKQLLGYINYFVEYCGCHVIIVGDETKVDKEDEKKILNDFKEKTVGREFEVIPDIDAAITHFVDEVPRVEWLCGEQSFIKRVFVASQCDNLRILRQCLYDFKQQYNESDDALLGKDTHIIKEILGSFIATYCEYKGKGRKTVKDLLSGRWSYFFSKNDSPEKEAIQKMEHRYDAGKLDGVNVLNIDHITNVVNFIERGSSMENYIDNLLRASQTVAGVLDRLQHFREMDDDVFEHDCNELADDLLNGYYRQFYPIGRALAYFSLFEKEGLYQVDETVIESAKATLKDLFTNEVKDAGVLYQCRSAFWQGMNTVENAKEDHRIHNEIAVFFKDQFAARDKELPDKLQSAFNNLNDSNVNDLFKIHESSTPDRQTSYSMAPIFVEQDIPGLMDRVKALNNANVRQFALFLSHHFLLGYGLSGDFSERFKDDLEPLQKMKVIIEKELETVTGIRMWAFQYLLKVVEGCIGRSEGVRSAQTEDM